MRISSSQSLMTVSEADIAALRLATTGPIDQRHDHAMTPELGNGLFGASYFLSRPKAGISAGVTL